ncbi:MAG TPA: carbamate kinase [Gemmatimonadaceae bacterium]|jgi:carbamate kinase|nr:carbamate kinase [Gemmatimonadaceae bacterium]
MTPRNAPTAVIALGGNALAPAGEKSTIYDQFRHTRESLGPIVDLAQDGWNVCVVHGNGPQVGDELLRNEVARGEANPLPLGVLVAATAGWIGYMIQQSIENALRRNGSKRHVATIITQVQVRADDPALLDPSKFIGQPLSTERAEELRREGHVVKADGRGNLRRVVGSPVPQAIHELGTIKRLVEQGTLVVACGGGGAPIYLNVLKEWEGLDAVIDKDLAAAVLARDLGAKLLLILTDVDAVYADWGTPQQRALRRLTVTEAEQMDRAGAFGEGSMAPKVRAAIDFARRTGGRAIITVLSRGQDAVRGEAGTTITAETA